MLKEADEQRKLHLKSAEIIPHGMDMTFEAWLHRLELWGRLNYFYKKPTTTFGAIFSGREKLTKSKFLEYLFNDESIYAFLGGKWRVVKDALNKMHFERDFVDIDGKKKKECLFVEIDLKPELRSAL